MGHWICKILRKKRVEPRLLTGRGKQLVLLRDSMEIHWPALSTTWTWTQTLQMTKGRYVQTLCSKRFIKAHQPATDAEDARFKIFYLNNVSTQNLFSSINAELAQHWICNSTVKLSCREYWIWKRSGYSQKGMQSNSSSIFSRKQKDRIKITNVGIVLQYLGYTICRKLAGIA